MTEDVTLRTYEIVASFVRPESALIRIPATSPEMAEAALRKLIGDVVRDLRIESNEEVKEDAPIPDGYREVRSSEVIPDIGEEEEEQESATILPFKGPETVH